MSDIPTYATETNSRSIPKRPTLGRLITSQLYQTSADDPLLLAMTISILGVAALVACLFPASRASLIDPIDALRIE